MRRRWIEIEKESKGGREEMEKARKRCDRQLHRARWQAGRGSVPSRGSWVQFARGETGERDFSSVSLMNLSNLSLSADKSLQAHSPLSSLARDSQGWQQREGR